MCFFCAILKTWKHAWSTSFGIANKYFPFASPRKLDSGDKRNIKVDFPLDESVLLRCPASMPDKKAINCIRYFSGWVFHFTFKNVKWKFFTQFSWRTKLFIQYYYHNEQFISGLSHSGGLMVSALDSGSSGFKPWPGTLCCVLGQDALLCQCLSPPRCIMETSELNVGPGGEWPCDWLAFLSGKYS